MKSKPFNLTLSNIPLVNLRMEFKNNSVLLGSADFKAQLQGNVRPIHTHYLIWFSYRGGLLTFLLQKGILGVESYLRGAVFSTLGFSGQFNEYRLKSLRNPFSLGGRGTADNFYNRLPGLISEDIKLKTHDQELWATTKTFYEEIRNPLFHGKEIDDNPSNIDGVQRAYEHIGHIYAWIDSWHDFIWPSGQVLRF